MCLETAASRASKGLLWTGRIISAIVVLFMGVMPIALLLMNRTMMIEGAVKYGYPRETAIPMVIAEILCTLLYAIPQTAMLGAILLTGYLGGAVATHVHASEYAQILFPLIMGVIVWLGILFREPRLPGLLPLRR